MLRPNLKVNGGLLLGATRLIEALGGVLDRAHTETTGRGFDTTLGLVYAIIMIYAAILVRESFWFHALLIMAFPLGLVSSIDFTVRIIARWRVR